MVRRMLEGRKQARILVPRFTLLSHVHGVAFSRPNKKQGAWHGGGCILSPGSVSCLMVYFVVRVASQNKGEKVVLVLVDATTPSHHINA